MSDDATITDQQVAALEQWAQGNIETVEPPFAAVLALCAAWRAQHEDVQAYSACWLKANPNLGVSITPARPQGLAHLIALIAEVRRLTQGLSEIGANAERFRKSLYAVEERAACLTQERDALREALVAVEWTNGEVMTCAWCSADQDDGHTTDCQRQAALRIGAERPQEGQ